MTDLTASDRRAVVHEQLELMSLTGASPGRMFDWYAVEYLDVNSLVVAWARRINQSSVEKNKRGMRADISEHAPHLHYASDEELADILVGAHEDGGEE